MAVQALAFPGQNRKTCQTLISKKLGDRQGLRAFFIFSFQIMCISIK